MAQPAGNAAEDIAAMGELAVEVPLTELRQNCDECVARKVKCVITSSAGCTSCLRKCVSCLFSMKLTPGPGSGRRKRLDGEGAIPPTGQFTAQQVKHARDLRQAAKQKVLELSREEDEIDTNETGEKATADDDEGSPLPNNKGKGKKRGRKQPRGEDKNKMARTHELLGTPRASESRSIETLRAAMGDAASGGGAMSSEIGCRSSPVTVADSKRPHSAVPQRAAPVGITSLFLSTWGNDVKLREGSMEDKHRTVLAAGGKGIMGTTDSIGRSSFKSGARPLTSSYIMPPSQAMSFLKPCTAPPMSSSTCINYNQTGRILSAAGATREKLLQRAYVIPEGENKLMRGGSGAAAALGSVGRVEPPKWIQSLNQDSTCVSSHGQAGMPHSAGEHLNGNTAKSIVASAVRGRCEAGIEVGGKGCMSGEGSGVSGPGGKFQESRQQPKSCKGLGLKDFIFLDEDGDESDIVSGGMPRTDSAGEGADLKAPMLNPGIGAPPTRIEHWHQNLGNAGAHDQPYALRHRMSGYISKGMSRNDNGASGDGSNHSYETGQTYERGMSSHKLKNGVGGGISGGGSGHRGKGVGEARQGLRRTGATCTPMKAVIVEGAEDWMPSTGFGEVTNSCKANPTHSTGHVNDDAWVRGVGVAGIANRNNCDITASSRESFGVAFGSTPCPPITQSPNDCLDSLSTDNDISSFLNENADWSDCYSEKSDPFYDVAFDDFDDV